MRSPRRCAGLLLAAVLLMVWRPLHAHPMPNTQIAVWIGAGGMYFDIAVPGPELRLALPREWPRDADLLAEPQRAAVLRYFDAHFLVQAAAGPPQPHHIQSLTRWQASDPDAGYYEELRLRILVPIRVGFEPRGFELHYDAIIHQVPNHFALVTVNVDFRNGQLDATRAREVGVIRYDFSRNLTPPLVVSTAPGNLWRGLRAAIVLGFHHVASGFDHLLFLATLLIVAPLRSNDGRWSLFQGWRYSMRRFLGISLAFTAGHSLALLAGTWGWLPVPRNAVEILIAASILLAALHAMRPLWPGREWLIAAGFGTVHGLAFAASLAGLALDPWTRLLTVSGFNLGVEMAQLAAMGAAVPLLFASRWRWFHAMRVTGMLAVALLALWWMVERTRLAVLPAIG